MNYSVTISNEAKRGCGFRKPSKNGVGIYLVGPKPAAPCDRLPFPIATCPTCGQGIKFSRGWTWIDPRIIFDAHLSPRCLQASTSCQSCPVCSPFTHTQAGLLWVGEKFYTPDSFLDEANRMGISKKIRSIPHSFEIGKHWVYMAHKKTPVNGETVPAIITAFMPTGIDLVIKDADNIPELAVNLLKRHESARLIKVVNEEVKNNA